MINSYKQSLKMIIEAHYILIVTHKNPDADTISCGLALSNFMFENRIKHKVFNSSKEIPQVLDFLNRFDKITDQVPKFYDLVIFVDCADKKRVGIDINNVPTINIDHHISNTNFATINIVDENCSSTAEVLYRFFKENNLDISKSTAECLYSGIYDDSLQFSTNRVDKNTFLIANELIQKGVIASDIAYNLYRRDTLAKYRILPKVLESLELHFKGEVATIYVLPKWLEETGATLSECEEALNLILNISIVDIAIFFRIVNNKVRVSFRSKKNDVSKIAKEFGGGGHKLASGCNIDTINLEEAKDKVLETLSYKINTMEKQ